MDKLIVSSSPPLKREADHPEHHAGRDHRPGPGHAGLYRLLRRQGRGGHPHLRGLLCAQRVPLPEGDEAPPDRGGPELCGHRRAAGLEPARHHPPPSSPCSASVVAIVVVKQMFGGIGQNFVNPALTARIILMNSFPAPHDPLGGPLRLRRHRGLHHHRHPPGHPERGRRGAPLLPGPCFWARPAAAWARPAPWPSSSAASTSSPGGSSAR